MAKRGVLSNDPAKVARREWYAQMQLEVFKKGDMDDIELEADSKKTKSKLRHSAKHGDDGSNLELKQSGENDDEEEEEKAEEKPLFATMPAFSNFALVLAEESLKKQEDRDNVVEKEPEIVPFDKPDDITPHRWIIPLNKLSMNTVAKCKLICFPGLGGSHLMFKIWVLNCMVYAYPIMLIAPKKNL